MNRIAQTIARLVAHRPWIMAVAGISLLVLSAIVLFSRQAFDTDILNLLPADRPAVKGLKIANERFTQARELTFVIQGKDPEEVDAFEAFLASKLRAQPWVVRVLDGSPIESTEGRADLQKLLIPLLLNLPPDQFRRAIGLLDPVAIRNRITHLRMQLEAGSPAAQVELETDPLGLLAAAAKPLAETSAMSDSFDLVSPDGRLRIIPVVTNQPSLSASDCSELMTKVRTFMAGVRKDFGSGAPELSVTGRTPYVDEIASSMQRDIALTSLVSLLTVTALFWFSFRRVVPLIGVSLLLATSAFVALAVGSLVFHELNVIAIGFCSILFGLGDDFGLLLYEAYRHERREGATHEGAITKALHSMLPGILWVTVTTAIGFLALTLSGSSGFAQLGAMVSLGVAVCAILVPTFIFLFIRDDARPLPAEKPVRFLDRPARILTPAVVVLLVMTVFAFAPVRSLSFDTSPHSLEPKDIPAARALDALMEAMPAAFEPALVVMQAPNVDVARTQSVKLDIELRQLVRDGVLDGFSSPTPLLLSPAIARTNEKSFSPQIAYRANEMFGSALEENGFSKNAFQSTFQTLRDLEDLQNQPLAPAWNRVLPPSSPWWFIIDRMLAPDGTTTATFLKPSPDYSGTAASGILESAVRAAGVPGYVTGWTQTLGTLVPWAENELGTFGSGVACVILVVLGIVYRDPRDWLAHLIGLALATGATVATLKLIGTKIDLLNVLAFPLMLAVGVDYGMHLILAVRDGHMKSVLKPVVISGLTTVTGFASLMLARNPSLSGLGTVCAIGVGWSLVAAVAIVLPLSLLLRRLASYQNER